MLTNKMFNCPSCGPVEKAYVYGDSLNIALGGIKFEITRPNFEEFSATLHEDSEGKLNPLIYAKWMAEIENYCSDVRRFQCCKCSTLFVLPKPAPKKEVDPAATAAATASGANAPIPNPFSTSPNSMFAPMYNVGSNMGSVRTIIDQLSEPDLDTILEDLGEDVNNLSGMSKSDKVDLVVDYLYN